MKMTRRLAFALGATVAAIAGTVDHAEGARFGPCYDLVPRQSIVRVHLTCERVNVDPPQRLDLVIGRLDAPRWLRPSWGGDRSVRWAERTLRDYGCGPLKWKNSVYHYRVIGIDCDY